MPTHDRTARARRRYVPPSASAAARVLFQASIAFGAGKGWIQPDDVDGILLIGGALVSMVFGVRVTGRRARELDAAGL